jgi:chromosome segregation ATPase
MQIKSIAMLAAAGCAIGILTGCGVPKEEHEAIVAELTANAQAAEDALNAELNDTKSQLDDATAKAARLQIEVNDSVDRIAELKSAADELTDSVAAEQSKVAQLESDLAAVKATVATSQQETRDAEKERDIMELEKQETQRRFDMLRKAILDLNEVNPDDMQIKLIVDDMDAPADTLSAPAEAAPTAAAPAAEDDSSLTSILDEMDSM